ncbi:glycosyltransferase family 2 protein [Chlorobium sp. N1]|uniref:glycosyltransferase family 2 protein n=1 Tax=Chlorobium sp. N1 TaxID=2491138 RepID=UPI00103FECC2|nr:glycosyltransferase family 2 protein [Chlorobium sp. N1]TCD46862.1 glycosyltransferase [Chlorobium sp. N1]
MKRISIVTACYNEEENIEEVYTQVREVFRKQLSDYTYEHLFIDNSSQDRTVDILKEIAKKDRNIKVIVNSQNFGHIRSPYHGLIQADGDAVISIVADLQDPPEMIVDFVRKWEAGNDIVVAVKNQSLENRIIYTVRILYYRILKQLSDVNIFENFTGFGLYDRKIIRILREINDPYPFFRGIISELGFKVATVNYTQPRRNRGITKNNFFTLYDMGILGIISNSKVPLRIATFFGFILSLASLLSGLGFLVGKILFWNTFQAGIAPMLIGNFFLFGVLLFFIGILGEYVGAIYTQILARPRVYEQERINFD